MTQEPQKIKSQYMIRHKAEALNMWIEGFLRDCRVRELSSFTIEFYKRQLTNFETFARGRDVLEVSQINADVLRSYLLDLETTGHNPGGRHAKYRAVRAFLFWWEQEAEPEAWSNPIAKVKPPRIAQEPIEGASLADIQAMIETCNHSFTGVRDRAILLCLLDTGARAREFLSINVEDVDTIGGGVTVRKTKNKKPRTVFIGKKSRRALRSYLKIREDESPALWVTSQGERLAVTSLRGVLERRANLAGVPMYSPHDFRRAFALLMLRAGVDVITLARLMGHSTLEVLKRYLKQNTDDLRIAHEKASPADKIF